MSERKTKMKLLLRKLVGKIEKVWQHAPCCCHNCYPKKQRALLRNIWNILESLQSEFSDQETKRRTLTLLVVEK